MAGFKTHITYGALTGALLSTISYTNDWSKELYVLVIIFFSSVVGSFLPDLDSDTGIPFRIVFGTISIIGSSIAFVYVFNNYSNRTEYLILIPILTFILIRYVLGFIFKKFTHHRGIYHSVPAMLIAFMLSIYIVDKFELELLDKFLISVSVSAGFLSHLILDELYASTSFLGIPYKTNRAFGSALEFISKSKSSTIMAYCVLTFLIYTNLSVLNDVYYLFK